MSVGVEPQRLCANHTPVRRNHLNLQLIINYSSPLRNGKGQAFCYSPYNLVLLPGIEPRLSP